MDKRHFTVVIGSKENGLYISSKPSSAAKKAVSKLCASNKSKNVEFCLREITQGSKKKTYGPYLGEMKKLKKPIELKGRVIRYEIKVHLKNRKSAKIKTAKKMRGGGPFNLNHNLNKYRDFVVREIENNGIIKNPILRDINDYIRLKNTSNDYDYIFFYIYDEKEIISIGVINKKPHIFNEDLDKLEVLNLEVKDYLYIKFLLSRRRGNRGGTSAIYHILSRLPEKYSGIFLHSTENARNFYKHLGFTEHGDLMILDKTQENIDILKAKLPQPIMTEFYSTYPDNIIT